jgi:ribosomal protein L34E
MTRTRERTGRIIAKTKRTPGNKLSTRYLKKGKERNRCNACGIVMNSVKSTGAKSGKTQTRIYGGNLCHSCLETVLKYGAKVKCKAMKIEEVPIKYKHLIIKIVEKL